LLLVLFAGCGNQGGRTLTSATGSIYECLVGIPNASLTAEQLEQVRQAQLQTNDGSSYVEDITTLYDAVRAILGADMPCMPQKEAYFKLMQVTPALFERFPTLEAFAAADVEEVERYIHSTGFFRAKARDIVACAQVLLEKHGGRVPGTMEELTALPGVGRKTANLILGDIFHVPGSTVVDTHCIRLSNRIGLVDGEKDPVKIETALRKLLPPEHSNSFCHALVLHGRAVCDARKPDCEHCGIRHLCQYFAS
jgi:endonuclease-3